MLERLFTPDRPAAPFDEDPEQLQASTQKLLRIAASEDVSFVAFGHDGLQWRSPKISPDSYG
jgi:glyoxylase-like metal-dependent hydrolase (beta-lactamase superfamily II)